MTAALAIAVVADLLQLPLALGWLAALLPAGLLVAGPPLETLAVAVDLVAAAATIALLGFHWVLLPTIVLEAVPVIGAAPTWTGCVLFVIWRKRQHAPRLPPRS